MNYRLPNVNHEVQDVFGIEIREYYLQKWEDFSDIQEEIFLSQEQILDTWEGIPNVWENVLHKRPDVLDN